MERPFISDREAVREMCKPVISYLRKNCDPYTEVHITMDEIKITTVGCGIPVKENDD